jgi:hypothetical protein
VGIFATDPQTDLVHETAVRALTTYYAVDPDTGLPGTPVHGSRGSVVMQGLIPTLIASPSQTCSRSKC